jgi:drug/metabolite transporter (DMT)-like permease
MPTHHGRPRRSSPLSRRNHGSGRFTTAFCNNIGLYQNVAFLVVAALLGLIFGGGGWHTTAHPSLSYLTAGWAMPSAFHLLLLGFIGATAAAAILLFTRAYALAEPSSVAPFEYTGLFWAVLFGFVIWGVVPGLSTLAGAALVIAAGLFMLRSATAPA